MDEELIRELRDQLSRTYRSTRRNGEEWAIKFTVVTRPYLSLGISIYNNGEYLVTIPLTKFQNILPIIEDAWDEISEESEADRERYMNGDSEDNHEKEYEDDDYEEEGEEEPRTSRRSSRQSSSRSRSSTSSRTSRRTSSSTGSRSRSSRGKTSRSSSSSRSTSSRRSRRSSAPKRD